MPERRIKVLQVVDGFRMGGAENKLAELVERLNPEKFESFIANVGPTGPLQGRFEQLGVPIFQCQRTNRFDVKPFVRLKQVMQKNKIDIVQTTLFWADFAGILAARWAHVPVILSWETVTHAGDPYHGKWQRRAGYRFCMRRADGVIAVSHEIKQSLLDSRRVAAGKIHVIHYGVDLRQFSPNGKVASTREQLGFRPDQVLLGIVARLEEVKGHRYFLEAFRGIAGEFPQAAALFVGDGSCRTALEQQAASLGLSERIHFLGIRKDVKDLLNCMDVFVLPSIAGEGLPNVILEAMACGKPIIASIVGGTPEAVRDQENGVLVPPRDVPALQRALRDLLRKPQLIRIFGEESRRIAEREFSLEKQIAAFEDLYSKLIKRKLGFQPASRGAGRGSRHVEVETVPRCRRGR